jgi:hypothetical protein
LGRKYGKRQAVTAIVEGGQEKLWMDFLFRAEGTLDFGNTYFLSNLSQTSFFQGM